METTLSQFIEQMRTLSNDFLAALASGDPAKVAPAQQAFSRTIEAAWQYFNRPDVPAKAKAIPRVIETWAEQDLPTRIQDPQNYPKLQHELRLFLSSLVLFGGEVGNAKD